MPTPHQSSDVCSEHLVCHFRCVCFLGWEAVVHCHDGALMPTIGRSEWLPFSRISTNLPLPCSSNSLGQNTKQARGKIGCDRESIVCRVLMSLGGRSSIITAECQLHYTALVPKILSLISRAPASTVEHRPSNNQMTTRISWAHALPNFKLSFSSKHSDVGEANDTREAAGLTWQDEF